MARSYAELRRPRLLRVRVDDLDLEVLNQVVRNFGQDLRDEAFKAIFRSLKANYAKQIAGGKRNSRWPSRSHGENSVNALYRSLRIEQQRGDTMRLAYGPGPGQGPRLEYYAKNIEQPKGTVRTISNARPGGRFKIPDRRGISGESHYYLREYNSYGRGYLAEATAITQRNLPRIVRQTVRGVRARTDMTGNVRYTAQGGKYNVAGLRQRWAKHSDG